MPITSLPRFSIDQLGLTRYVDLMKLKHVAYVIAAIAGILVSSSCSTVSGALSGMGKDIQKAGNAISNSVN